MVSIFKERIYTFTCILMEEEPLGLFFNGHTTSICLTRWIYVLNFIRLFWE